MTRAANIFFGLFTLGTVIAVAVVQPANVDPRQKAIEDYRDWQCITPEAVNMAPWIAKLCRVAPEYGRDNPHIRTFFKVFVNDKAKSMMNAPEPRFPVGSVIVKEKFEVPSGSQPKKLDKPNLLTVMVKREKGFDGPNGDWEYFTAAGNGKPSSADLSVKHCQSCHLGKKSTDYTFRTYGDGKRVASNLQSLLVQHP